MNSLPNNSNIARRIFEFGEFSFDAAKQILWRGAETVPLAPKACEILAVLIENAPQLVSKEELMNRVWSDSFVEEANLTHHISALRKTLGEDKYGRKFIETIPRKGYRFVAPVSESSRDMAEIVVSEQITERFFEAVEIKAETTQETTKIGAAESKLMPSANAPRKDWRARRWLIFGAAGVLLATIAGVAAFVFYARRGWTNRSVVNAPVGITEITEGRLVGGTIVSPDGKFVAYFQNFTIAGGGTIFLRQLETNREVRLLEPDERTFGNMDFSPDGALIYYVSFEKDAKTGAFYSLPILGGQPRRLFDLDAASAFFAVSPDGRQVAFYRSDEQQKTTSLIVRNLDGAVGESERVLYSYSSDQPSFWGFLAWSPDGRYLAAGKMPIAETPLATKIYRIDVQTGEVAALSDEEFINIGKIIFRPDGGELFFVGNRNGTQQIYALDVASRQIRRVTGDTNSYGNYGLSISRDGKMLTADFIETKANLSSVAATGGARDAQIINRGTTLGRRGIAALPDDSIAYIARSTGNYDVWKIGANGANLRQLTNDAFQERDLTASRDGRFLVFSSDHAGGRHLFRINAADGSDVKQLTFGETEDRQPDFSPDGKEIVYASGANENTIIKKISVEGGAPVALTDFFGVTPVYSPDGSRVALKILSRSRSLPGKIVVIPASGGKPEHSYEVAEFEYFPASIPIRWTPDGKAIVFRRELNSVSNLWQQNLDDSAPRQITDLPTDTIYSFVYSADGSRIFLSSGFFQSNAVLLSNF